MAFNVYGNVYGEGTGGGVVAPGEATVERDIFVTRGDDITLIWDLDDNWPSLTGATIKYGHGYGDFEKEMTLTGSGIALVLTKEETAAMRGSYRYDIQATLSDGAVTTLAKGTTYLAETETDVPTNQPIDIGWVS